MYVVAYYIVSAIRNDSTMVNSKTQKKNIYIVSLFYIAMHDPTIYMIWSPRGTSNVYT